MNLHTALQASFISEMGVSAAKSAVLNLMNLVKDKSNSRSISRCRPSQTNIGPALVFAENYRAEPSFLHMVQGRPAAVLGYDVAEPIESFTRLKRHRLTAAKPRVLTTGGADVLHF
jgi:hypothetical protein